MARFNVDRGVEGRRKLWVDVGGEETEGSSGVPGLLGGVSVDLQEVSPWGWWGRQAPVDSRSQGSSGVPGAFEPRGNACLPLSDRGASPGEARRGGGVAGERGAEGSGQGCLVAQGWGCAVTLVKAQGACDLYGVAQRQGPPGAVLCPGLTSAL